MQGPLHLCRVLAVGPFNTWLQVEKKKMLLLAEQMPQMSTISLKIVEVVILSENQVLNGPIAKNQCIYTI